MVAVTRSVRVLVVDDQDAFRSAARMVVELTDGFEVAGEASSGEEGVRLSAELEPDLVLMDMKMDGMDGLEATRRIVAARPDARVVAVSTYEEFEQRALAAGAVAFMPKSRFDAVQLVTAWESIA